jgi:hypothetical protein
VPDDGQYRVPGGDDGSVGALSFAESPVAVAKEGIGAANLATISPRVPARGLPLPVAPLSLPADWWSMGVNSATMSDGRPQSDWFVR